MGYPSKPQRFMSIIFHIIQEICNSDAFIGHVHICDIYGCNLLITLQLIYYYYVNFIKCIFFTISMTHLKVHP